VTNWAARVLNFKRGEIPLAVLAALFYFCVLCGYYFLRPVREAMGVSRGMDDLRWLFVGSAVASLAIVLLFGGIVSRLDRRRFIPIGYLFVIVCLIGFSGLLVADALAGGGLVGTDTGTTFALAVGYSFFIWLTVINLFVNSLFWAFMVDLFNVDQGKRMFAFIGIGGTLGALFGGWATNSVSAMTDSVYLAPGLMLTGAALFGAAILIMLRLDALAMSSEHSRLSAQRLHASVPEREIGGSYIDGVKALLTSPYLLGIAAFFILMTIANTLIYFTQANVILENTDTFSQRVGGFAEFDMLAQVATLLTQMFITTHLIRRFGVGWTLALLPLVTLGGFTVLAIWPTYGVMMVFQALHRAARYSMTRPARETLFSVVPTAEKYKAKPVIDVFVYRGGDLVGAGIDGAMRAAGLTLVGFAASCVPLAVVWGLLSLALGRAQARRDAATDTPSGASAAEAAGRRALDVAATRVSS
jgi:AAA family ATP:ADP antiporter